VPFIVAVVVPVAVSITVAVALTVAVVVTSCQLYGVLSRSSDAPILCQFYGVTQLSTLARVWQEEKISICYQCFFIVGLLL
jgi:hypothetical protein